MEINELKQKFIVLMDHFHAAVEEIRALRNRLSKAQDTIDAMEIDKIRFGIYETNRTCICTSYEYICLMK